MTTLVVIAKETIPGKVKTRLHPPLSLEQAADVAAAAIQDTLAVGCPPRVACCCSTATAGPSAPKTSM